MRPTCTAERRAPTDDDLAKVTRGFDVLQEFLIDGQEDSSAKLAELLGEE